MPLAGRLSINRNAHNYSLCCVHVQLASRHSRHSTQGLHLCQHAAIIVVSCAVQICLDSAHAVASKDATHSMIASTLGGAAGGGTGEYMQIGAVGTVEGAIGGGAGAMLG